MALMSPRPKSKQTIQKPEDLPRWKKWLLTLSLVPLVVGVILIFAWAIDWDMWGALEDQIVIGTLFLFFGFGLTNVLQSHWELAAGWLLLMVADWMVLAAVNTGIQRIGMVLGVGGLIILGFEYFRRIAQNRKKQVRKS